MELIDNLIQHKLIQPGSWLGIKTPQGFRVQQRLRVERVVGVEIWACVQHTGQIVCVPPEHIQEVDGMTLNRLCAQADLDQSGCKLAPKTRRGRKPKHVRAK